MNPLRGAPGTTASPPFKEGSRGRCGSWVVGRGLWVVPQRPNPSRAIVRLRYAHIPSPNLVRFFLTTHELLQVPISKLPLKRAEQRRGAGGSRARLFEGLQGPSLRARPAHRAAQGTPGKAGGERLGAHSFGYFACANKKSDPAAGTDPGQPLVLKQSHEPSNAICLSGSHGKLHKERHPRGNHRADRWLSCVHTVALSGAEVTVAHVGMFMRVAIVFSLQ